MPGGWEHGLEDPAVNSPANCIYRARLRVDPRDLGRVEIWTATGLAATGLCASIQPARRNWAAEQTLPSGYSWHA
jgi:hypothetical protein